MKESTVKLNEKLNFVGCDYRVAAGVYGYNTAINFDVPVFALSGDCSFAAKNFLAAELNDIFYIIAKFEITADTVYAHWRGVKFFDIIYQIIFHFIFLTGWRITVFSFSGAVLRGSLR